MSHSSTAQPPADPIPPPPAPPEPRNELLKKELLANNLSVDPYTLRGLVFNYLYVNGYSATAKEFSRNFASPSSADTDDVERMASPGDEVSFNLPNHEMRIVEIRKEIRTEILAGKMDKAIALLKQYFPTVLSSPTTSMESLTSPASRDVLRFISTTSLTSAHLTLNLHIHSFIEACRTIPLAESSTSKGSKSTTVDGDSPPKLWDESHYADLLQRMRRLHSDTLKLPEKHDLVKYTAELTNVAGLLAYPIPEHSPLARYFSHERREAVADQINHAILYRLGKPAVSKLELYTRYTATLISLMHDIGIKPSKRSPVSFLAPSEEETEILPQRFDLNHFLGPPSMHNP